MLSRLLLALTLAVPVFAQTRSYLSTYRKEAVTDVEAHRRFTQKVIDQTFSYGELGFQEVETSRYLTEILEKSGFKVEHGVAGIPTAWVASYSYGSGKPVIGFMTDLDGIPQASQRPGVAYHDPILAGAPGHGEGHNSGQAVNITAALTLKMLMEKYKISGTLKLYPGIAEELLGSKAFMVRAGLFKDVDIMLGCHVDSEFASNYGQPDSNSGLVSVQYSFHGVAAHAAAAPWAGKSALDAVELMDAGWNAKREHLRLEQRSHRVIFNGGEQPNVVPSEAGVWYFFRELDYPHITDLFTLGNTMADAAAMMTGTTVTRRLVGSAWPSHFNKVIAETEQKNIELIGMPEWNENDQTLARALQKEIGTKVEGLHSKVRPLEPPKPSQGGGSDDIGDVSWNLPTVYLRYPANIPNLPGHSWPSAVAMATPIAHKGATAGAKVQALTALDFLLQPRLVPQAWSYFRDVQTKDVHYQPLISAADRPALDLNREKMERFRPAMREFYFNPGRFDTYLEQLGVHYPTVRQ